jgi:cytochrome b pre-mRNA-processing protein 3
VFLRLQFLAERLEAVSMIRIFAPFIRFLRPRYEKLIGLRLYESCVVQSRLPVFYLDYGVEDQKGARFELLNLHVALVVNALRRVDANDPLYDQAKDTAQSLFDGYLLALDTTMR